MDADSSPSYCRGLLAGDEDMKTLCNINITFFSFSNYKKTKLEGQNLRPM